MSLRLRLRVESDCDEGGFIIFALLAMMVVGGVGALVLGTVLNSEHANRHDLAFEESLQAAEAGLDALTAQVKAAPYASTVAPISSTDSTTGASYTTYASGGSGSWVVTSTGTAHRADSLVHRTISQTVTVQNVLGNPIFGRDKLTLGGTSGASGVDVYDSTVSSAVCTPAGAPALTLAYDTRMCQPVAPGIGPVATDGPLTMTGADITRVSGADIYDTPISGFSDPDATGACAGDATTCAAVGSTVHLHHDRLDYPVSTLCSQGVGAGAGSYDGSYALAANAIYNFTDVTLNVQAIANLSNLSGSRIVVCFSGDLVIPPLLPLNETLSPALTPRVPSSLLLVSTAPPGATPRVSFGQTSVTAPGASLSLAGALPSSISAVIYAPNAACSAAGHVDVYGAVVCGSVDAEGGMDVHYDTELGNLDFDRPVQVSHWRETAA